MIPRAVREGSQRSKSKTWGVVSWEGSTRHACCHVETLRIVHKGRCIAVGKSAVVVTWVADASGHMDVLWTSLIVCTQTFFGFWPKQHLSFASLSHGLHRNYTCIPHIVVRVCVAAIVKTYHLATLAL